jgi:V8-like Glu-specific endopeptidase
MILNIYLYNPDGTKTVIGIHVRKAPNSYEYNEATRITSNILNFIFNNSNL